MKTVMRIALLLAALSVGVVLGVAAVLWRMDFNPFTGDFGGGPTRVEPGEIPPTPPIESQRPVPPPSVRPS